MISILFFLKSIWSVLIAFASTKLGQIILLILSILMSIFYAYNLGFKKGMERQQIIYQIQFDKELEIKTKEQKIEQEKANKEAIAFVLSQQKDNIVYKDKIVTIEKLVKSSPKIIKQCDEVTDEDFIKYKKELKGIK